MKKKESVLGRGLSSILNDPSNNSLKISEKSNPNYSKISLKKISLNPNQPRTNQTSPDPLRPRKSTQIHPNRPTSAQIGRGRTVSAQISSIE